jgi:hypothetical protein
MQSAFDPRNEPLRPPQPFRNLRLRQARTATRKEVVEETPGGDDLRVQRPSTGSIDEVLQGGDCRRS